MGIHLAHNNVPAACRCTSRLLNRWWLDLHFSATVCIFSLVGWEPYRLLNTKVQADIMITSTLGCCSCLLHHSQLSSKAWLYLDPACIHRLLLSKKEESLAQRLIRPFFILCMWGVSYACVTYFLFPGCTGCRKSLMLFQIFLGFFVLFFSFKQEVQMNQWQHLCFAMNVAIAGRLAITVVPWVTNQCKLWLCLRWWGMCYWHLHTGRMTILILSVCLSGIIITVIFFRKDFAVFQCDQHTFLVYALIDCSSTNVEIFCIACCHWLQFSYCQDILHCVVLIAVQTIV